MDGSCHCGAVRLAVPEAPRWLSECNCSICRRTGAAWSYWPGEAVRVEGATATYAWGARDLDFHRCTVCGCVTHWTERGRRAGEPGTRVGVNARLLDGWPFPDAEREMLDGAAL